MSVSNIQIHAKTKCPNTFMSQLASHPNYANIYHKFTVVKLTIRKEIITYPIRISFVNQRS